MRYHQGGQVPKMRYYPSRGGHAPGHLRDAFLEWTEEQEGDTVVVGLYEEEKPLAWILGQLWNCTDILPGDCCNDLDLPSGSTYARAVRAVKEFQTA